ncbi:hypothetical protein Tco_0325866, partial [Tanacetum coccineum]
MLGKCSDFSEELSNNAEGKNRLIKVVRSSSQDSMVGTGYSLKVKNEAKADKTKHGNRKS